MRPGKSRRNDENKNRKERFDVGSVPRIFSATSTYGDTNDSVWDLSLYPSILELTHRSTDTKEKPFRCISCTEAFTRRYVLVFHVRTINTEITPQRPAGPSYSNVP